MNYVVLDLEWNQSNNEENMNRELPFEIIEIGAIKLSQDKYMVGEFSELIKPQVYHQMHRITSKLIHLQMQELERGRPFKEVATDFLNWCGEDYVFCTWGPLDLAEFQSNMRYYGMEPLAEGPIAFLDVQKLFSLAYEDGKSRRSLETAVDFLNIEKDIPFHRAFSDAYYTGKVLAKIQDPKILERYSFDVFHAPKTKEDEIHVVFDTYAKDISRVFNDKVEALHDKDIANTRCYVCRRGAKKRIRWFSTNGKHYYCLAFCDQHGFMKGKIRVKKTDDDKVYIVKTTKLISHTEAEKIAELKEKAKEIRKSRKKRK